ncbi:penicillin-binding protein activator [Pseudomonas profundi]|uniref:penicillin-binding protein activator n=1 Tax=Pseudomonas profundi TaxID=1981513 RepID=UPI0016801CFF|nr:penicillin-binding protein activator [Pseudomonas profundi]
MPRMNRLSLTALAIAVMLGGCATPPPSQLSDLPRTPDATVEEILEDAERYSGAEAYLLRLYAAQAAWSTNQPERVRSILSRIPQSELPPDQQLRFAELQARSALALEQPEAALLALRHPSMIHLETQPIEEQLAIQQLRAEAFQATGDPLNAARERAFIDGMLPPGEREANRQAIWEDLNRAPLEDLRQAAGEATGEFAGWVQLALISREQSNLDLQVQSVNKWKETFSDHPAARLMPDSIAQLLELHANRPTHIALFLPFEGPLAGAAQALRDGFMASQYQAHSQGLEQPQVSLYDSTAYADLMAFYRDAEADGVQWVIGPLERDQVSRLAGMTELPLPTLALNYTDSSISSDQTLFQFGLAPEDEARSAARRAWDDGHRNMAVLAAQTDWGQRSFEAFRAEWEALGGKLVGREIINEPATISSQIADLLNIRESEQRGARIQSTLGNEVVVQPTPRQDLHALFLAATPQQARQIKPTLAFQYAADLPVYATSHAYQLGADAADNADLDGLLVAEIPWLLTRSDALYETVSSSWPQATGPMGRLYAMGADAQRLFSRLPQLQRYEEASIEGATGRLSLSADGRVHRSLGWGVISEGRIVPVDEVISAP